MSLIALAVYVILVYFMIGIGVGGFALLARATYLDARLAAAPLRVRFLMLPGAAVFWPIVLTRALKGSA